MGRINRKGLLPKNDEMEFLKAAVGIKACHPSSRSLQLTSPHLISESVRSGVSACPRGQNRSSRRFLWRRARCRPKRSIRKDLTASALASGYLPSSGIKRSLSSVIFRCSASGLSASRMGRMGSDGPTLLGPRHPVARRPGDYKNEVSPSVSAGQSQINRCSG